MSRPAILLCCVLTIVACDKKSPPSPPVVTPPGTNETITGSERVGWDQRAADTAELATIGYVLYVDAIRTPLADPTCNTTASASGFTCSARLPALTPGAHALQLASFINDGGVLESERSAAINVTVAAAVTRQPDRTEAFDPVRFIGTNGDAMRAELVTDGLEDPTDLGFAPDGRVFIAERGGRVRIVRDQLLLRAPALALAGTAAPDTMLVALALDPDFDRTGFLFAIYVSASRSGEPTFTLARFREASNTLADRIVLLDGVRASASPAAAVRFGADKKLYIAFDDGGDPRRIGDAASLNGKLLRLNADGTTPADQRGMSPVRADGIAAPRGFDWDPKSGSPSAAVPTSSAPYRGPLFPGFAGSLLMANTDGRLVSRSAAGRIEALAADRIGGVRVVAVSPGGAIYFATANAIGRLVPDTAGP